MKNKYFKRIMVVILVAGMISSAALIGYTVCLRTRCSVISLISNEGK